MKKVLLVALVISLMTFGQMAQVAAAPQLVQTVNVVADKNVTPMDSSFFDQPAAGRVELYNVKNLWGAGAGMIFYVETDQGADWLMLGFGSGMVEIRLQNKKIALFSEKVTSITPRTPLTMTIQDGKLTVEIGKRSRTVTGVNAFTGNFTTQSIEGTLKAYQFTE